MLLERIGLGGMAEVHLACAQGLSGFEKGVALKVIHGHLVDDPAHVELLLREARIAATLDHPSIVQVFDVGVDGGEYYLCMEYVHGIDLRQMLRRLAGRERIPLPLALLIVHEVAGALHYAHTRRNPAGQPLGIVHRDVSPSNVIVAFSGAVKLTDFGIAKITAHTSHTSTGTLKGKFGYMSPEQSLQQDLDARSDVFALGVLLYELTTGRRAFPGESTFATMNAVIEGLYAPPERHVPDYPAALAAIVRRALAVEREDRYPTAEAMQLEIAALARELGGVATLAELGRFVGDLFAWPPMPEVSTLAGQAAGNTEVIVATVTSSKVARRNRVLWAGIGSAMVAAVFAGWAGWQAGRTMNAAVPVAAPTVITSLPRADAPVVAATSRAAAPTLPRADAPVVAATSRAVAPALPRAEPASAKAVTPDSALGANAKVAAPELSRPEPPRTERRRKPKPRPPASDRGLSNKDGIEAFLPPSARRAP